MRKHEMPEVREANINVTPLIDIIMCLIVFYMLAAKIGVSTGAESMELPETLQGTKIEMANTLTLNVRSGPLDQPLITALVEDEKRELKLVETAGGTTTYPLLDVLKRLRARTPEFKVIIRAEKDLNYRFLEPVLLVCAQADVKNVNFNTAQVQVRGTE